MAANVIVKVMTTQRSVTPFPLFRLLVISGAIFVVVTSEFLPTGLLPDMAAELGVSLSQIGLLVTIFAVTVVVTTVPLTALTTRFPRKWLMVVLLGVFAVAMVLGAVSPTYEVLVGVADPRRRGSRPVLVGHRAVRVPARPA